jgi:peptidyl-prolyl cis-trans isomerase C
MTQFYGRSGLLGALLASSLLVAAPALVSAQEAEQDAEQAEQAEEEDPVVAVVDGTPIRFSEVTAYAYTLPPQYRQAFNQIFPFLVQRLIDLALIDKAAKADGLSDDQEVQERVDRLTVEVMREVYMERLLEAEVSEAEVEARYQTFLEENPPEEEVRARHILLESEEEAREVIAALDEGADFVALAEERSTGPSAAQGGDLGYFTNQQMVPSFAETAFALEPGSYNSDPVQTEFGWHVILVEDKRTKEQPTFEQVEPQLKQELQGEVVEGHLAELRDDAEIEVIERAEPQAQEPAMEAPAMEEPAMDEPAMEEPAESETQPSE